MSVLILGIDEAGRGAAISDMVMACAAVQDYQHEILTNLGVKDSKAFKGGKNPRGKRAKLASALKEMLPYKIKKVGAPVIDMHVLGQGTSLNSLERDMAVELIEWAIEEAALDLNKIILDSNDMFNEVAIDIRKRYGIACEAIDKADDKFIAVSAASIIAKAQRDHVTEQLMGNFFNNGAGYCNKGTEEWIRSWYEFKDYPDFEMENPMQYVRQSWSWFQKLEDKLKKEMVKENA